MGGKANFDCGESSNSANPAKITQKYWVDELQLDLFGEMYQSELNSGVYDV